MQQMRTATWPIKDGGSQTFEMVDGVARDILEGKEVMQNDMNMGGAKVTNLGNAVNDGDALALAFAKTLFAPSGYGLGEQLGIIQAASASETHATYCGKIDAILSEMGDYEIKFIRAVPPELYGAGVYMCVLHKYDDSFAELRVISTYSTTRFGWRITKTNGDWMPLEWFNPPMVIGVEYRTAERWNGQVVYAKCVNFGHLPSSSYSEISENTPGKQRLVRYEITCTATNDDVSRNINRFYFSASTIGIQTSVAFNQFTAFVTLYYTKA